MAIFVDGGHESLGAEHFDGAFASFGEAVASTLDRFGIGLLAVVMLVGAGFFIRHKLIERKARAEVTSQAADADLES